MYTSFLNRPVAVITASSLFKHAATSLVQLLSLADSPVSNCRISSAPSGWMGNVGSHPFSHLSMDVQVWPLVKSLKVNNGVVLKPLLRYLGCVFGVTVPLKHELLPQSEVKSALQQVFNQHVSILYCIHRSLYPDSMMLPPPCFSGLHMM